MSGVRQALIDSGHFTEGPNRTLIHEEPIDSEGFSYGDQHAARTVLRFDMWGDLVEVKSCLVNVAMRAMVAGNRNALKLPPQESE